MLFFKILFILLGVYWIGKWIIRSVLSYFLGDAAKNMNDRLRRQKEETVRQKKKQEGKVTINYQPKSDKNFGKEEGDYVDFEEVK
ncbi:MAG: DUF4834 family protein [Dysgonamonadaceae bacterium]|jgi:hypothetical protein|nr:DUF4834 family protein [Dysgonamonadaceae bacterium]